MQSVALWSPGSPSLTATSGTSATGTDRRLRERIESIALRLAIVRTHARTLESGRRRGYAFNAEMNVSWKTSSASSGPIIATK